MNEPTQGQFLLLAAIIICTTLLVTLWGLETSHVISQRGSLGYQEVQQAASVALEAIANASKEARDGHEFERRAREYVRGLYSTLRNLEMWCDVPLADYSFRTSSIDDQDLRIVAYRADVVMPDGKHFAYIAEVRMCQYLGYWKILAVHRRVDEEVVLRLEVIQGGVILGREGDGSYIILPLAKTLVLRDSYGIIYRLNADS
ncbi:MAG: hypothetical protein J7L11_05540 [Thermoprotei archaeon]|nr:hypothetical protein [Thermoprotei archaeon]